MLDKLVISNDSAGKNGKRQGILFTTFMVVISLFTVGMIYSLFSQNLAMGQENLNISTLIAPPVIPQQKPPEPKAEKPKNQPGKQAVSKIITRKENIQRVNETPVKIPKTVSTQKSTALARPDAPYIVTGKDTRGKIMSNNAPTTTRGETKDNGLVDKDTGLNVKSSEIKTKTKKTIPKPPPIVKQKPKAPVTKGVINGKAINLVKPIYPAIAKQMGLRGKVTIQVVVDENGRVISASPLKGHKLLTRSALKAARATKFSSTYLGSQKVKVRGVIVYNFSM